MRVAVASVAERDNSFATRMLAALRNEFGGHAVKAASTGEKKGKRDG